MYARTMLVFTVITLTAAGVAFAQEQNGTLFGTVTNEDGASVQGVNVTVASPALIGALTINTNERGYYFLPALPVGNYTILFEADSYTSLQRGDIELSAGAQLRVNAVLERGALGEQVISISGDAPLIDVKSSDTGLSISRRVFDALPKGRDFTDIVTIAPGANYENISGGLQIDGASAAENVFYIDGVDVTSFYSGLPTQTAPFEFIDEIQVRTGGYEAEFGGALGGVINVISRGGGDEFHGDVTYHFNSDWLDGSARPTLRINPVDDSTAEYITYPRDEYARNEIGASLGGPLIPNRVWFYASYMPVFQDTTRTVNFRDSDDNIYLTRGYEQEQRTHRLFGKLTTQLGGKLRITGSYMSDWTKTMGDLPSADGSDEPDIDPSYSERGSTEPGYFLSLSGDWTISENLFATVKSSFHRTDYHQIGANQEILYRFYGNMEQLFGDDPAFQAIPDELVPAPYYMSRPEEFYTSKDLQEKFSYSNDVTWFLDDFAGNHTIKAGAQYNYIHNDVDSTYTADYIYFVLDLPYVNSDTGVAGRGPYGFYFVLTAHPDGYGKVADVSSHRYALFLQDSWQVTDRLTLNLGLRAEREDIPSFSDEPEYSESPVSFDFLDKLAPRLGFSYDVRGDGTFKLYGSYGRYFDVVKLQMAQSAYGGYKWQERFYTLDTLDWWNYGGNSFGEWPRDDYYPGTLLASIDHRIPAFDTTDPDIKPTSTDEYMLGADYQLAEDLALDIRFVHKRLSYIIEDVGVNTPEGEISYITNPGYGYSLTMIGEGYPPTPKAKRHYWGLEFRLTKRFSDGWTGGANVTFSRLTGNISGLANTDDFGGERPNTFPYFDEWFANYDANWNAIEGPLATDRRYAVKLFGSRAFGFGLTVGVLQVIQDGTPLSTQFALNGYDSYMPYGRGDLGRTPLWTQTDLYAEYNFHLGRYQAQLNVNVTNLFDQETAWSKYTSLSREEVRVDEDTLLAYFQNGTAVDIEKLFRPYHTGRYDSRFLMDDEFQEPRTIRLGLKFFF